ncbi:hypothetical protein [Streptomyces vinaceus]|uniref:hypothetical protein n=1 Tax=Streptomyces vinaceus TaxID=1960 RepID=UPI0035DBFD36
MRFVHARAASAAVSLGAGLLLGLLGPVAGKWDTPVCVAVGIVFSSGWPWACYAFLVGYFRRSKIEAALLASSGLAIGVVTYYLFKEANPTIPAGVESAASVPDGMESGTSGAGQILVWGMAAFVFGAPLGLMGNVARTPGIGGLLFRLLVPLIAFFEATQRLSVEADSQGPVFSATWNVTRVAACAVAIALVGQTVWSGRVRRRDGDRPTETAAPARRH